LQQALQLCGECKDAALLHKNLAFFYEKTGKLSDAEAELEKTLALDPNDTKAQQGLAQLRSLTTAAP
jgi:Tfp pilus assembly protein PilF